MYLYTLTTYTTLSHIGGKITITKSIIDNNLYKKIEKFIQHILHLTHIHNLSKKVVNEKFKREYCIARICAWLNLYPNQDNQHDPKICT